MRNRQNPNLGRGLEVNDVRFRDGRLVEEPIDRSQVRAIARDLFGIDLGSTPLVFESPEE